MTRIHGRSAWLALCAVCLACSTDTTARTQVMVTIDAESAVRAMAVDVDIEVRTGTGPVGEWDPRGQRSLTPGKGIAWPLEAALVPRKGAADRVYWVAAVARDGAGKAIAEVRAISGYQAGKTVSLLLLFEDSCLNKQGKCNETQTCRSGDCVDAHVDPKDLEVYVPHTATDGGPDGSESIMTDSGGSDANTGSPGDAGGMSDGGPSDAHIAPCAIDADCDDSDACNGKETCAKAACVPGKAFECDDSGDLCRPNVCKTVKGKPTCKPQNAEDGVSCDDGDESTSPKAMCARDYECVSGQCEPQTVEACNPSQCEATAGCDADTGCVFEPLDVSTTCTDDDLCTEDDHCSGTDGQCVSTPMTCDDAVPCTIDACDGTGTCTHTPSDALCGGPCKTGTCNLTMGCLNVTFAQDFTDCTDSNASTSPDLCYRGECLGGRQGAPTGSCKLAGCECSGFGAVRDLQFSTNKFAGLIETSQDGGGGSCTTGTVSTVFDVTLGALTPYASLDTNNGGVSEGAMDLDLPYVVSSSHVALANVTDQTVDWLDTTYGAAITAQTPSIANFRGSARHSTGSFVSTSHAYFWLWGTDSTTASTGRIVRCSSCSSNVVGGCTGETGITCTDVTSLSSTTVAGLLPYTGGGISTTYGGVVTLLNLPSGGIRKRIFEDGTSKDMSPSQSEADDADGAWSGVVRMSATGQVLAYGSGSNNVRVCTDATNTGDTTCAVVSGLPNQAVRAYTRADRSGSAALMLAATGSNAYLLMLPTGLDPATGSNWREISIANSGTTTANAVAISPTSFMVLGKAGAAPYVWYWGPP